MNFEENECSNVFVFGIKRAATGQRIPLPRSDLTNPFDALLFKLREYSSPFTCYLLFQGHSCNKVGFYFPEPIFMHGQFVRYFVTY